MRGFYAAILVTSGVLVAGCGGDVAAPPASSAEGDDAAVAEVVEAPAAPAASAVSRAPARQPSAAAPRAGVAPARPAQSVPERREPVQSVPEYREVTLPTGTTLSLTLTTRVASDENQVEDVVRATLSKGVMLGEDEVLGTGSQLVGRVTDLEKSGRIKGRARVAFRFTTLTADGDEYDVRTALVERVAESAKSGDLKKVGIGAGAGAALGAVLGGGSGAAKGAAIGAAAGTGVVLATKGDEVQLEAGTPVSTTLSAPLNVRVRMK